MKNISQEEINERYHSSLLKLIEKLEEGFKLTNEIHGVKHGYILMVVRDPSKGNVDVIHNYSKDKDVVTIMELATETVRKGNTEQTLNP